MGNKNVKLSTIVHPTPVALAVLACLATVPGNRACRSMPGAARNLPQQ